MKRLKKFNESPFFGSTWNDDSDDINIGPLSQLVKHDSSDFQTKPGFVEKRMKQQKEYESKYTISIPVPVSAYELLKKSGVTDENIVAAYTEYVKHSLGLPYGTDLEEFRTWCEESDNLVDFLEPKEKPKFRTLTDEEKEKMMSDALKMSEDQWMKKYPVGDHGDYLRRARTKWNID